MKTEYLYISGPISKDLETAYERFNICQNWIITNTFYIPLNPYGLNKIKLKYNDGIENPTELDFMRSSYYYMTKNPNTSMVFLPGYKDSTGAMKELYLANDLKYPVYTFSDTIPTIFGLPERMLKK